MTEPQITITDHPFRCEITKEEINALPLRHFEGPITLVRERAQLPATLKKVQRETVLGFDTETRPAFKKGQSFKPSVMQLATASEVFVIQIGLTGLTDGLVRLMENPDILKVGVGLEDDKKALASLRELEPAGFVELGPLANTFEIKPNGLRGLAASVLEFRISKRAQCSNWANRRLTDQQIQYAATDAWVSREIHRALSEHLDQANGANGHRKSP